MPRRRRRHGRGAVALVAALALAACQSGEADGPSQEPAEAEEADAGAGEADDGPAAASDVATGAPRLAVPGAAEIELTTPGAGQGPWPVLAWEPVDGAARYQVTLYAASGEAYWTWAGQQAEVRVGAFDEPPAEGSGLAPRVSEQMSWDVVAQDEDGSVVALSGERPIAP